MPGSPATPPAGSRPPRRPEGGAQASPGPSEVERLAGRLRGVYARLDEYRREPTISAEQERQRRRDLADYDRALVALCEALGHPTGVAPGAPVSVDARATLTRALAKAGFDVRANGGPPGRHRPRWGPSR
jgi:hypothetical protein